VITAMLRSADVDALIPRAIIQALIPGVLGLSRRIDIAGGPWSDLDAFYADAISALWELTMSWSGGNRPYAAGDLLSAVRTRLRTLQVSELRRRSHQTSTPDALDTLPASIGRTGEELLAAALADATGNGLSVTDGAILYATRVLGMSLGEVADLAEVPASHLRRRRRNAIDRLVA
jgi:DNA-directed RNA polymerase specialized sigma24 family protein